MTVARKWLAPSSTLHLVRVGTLTVRRSWLMVVILLSILRELRDMCSIKFELYKYCTSMILGWIWIIHPTWMTVYHNCRLGELALNSTEVLLITLRLWPASGVLNMKDRTSRIIKAYQSRFLDRPAQVPVKLLYTKYWWKFTQRHYLPII